MRQKQSKKGSRKQEQRSSPAVKHEAETLPIFSNTTDKSQSGRLEFQRTSSMPYSISEKEYDKGLERELEDRYERYREILKDLTLMSDSFMRAVLKNPKCTEEVLRIILNKNQLQVVDQRLQADYKNLQGRSAILDCVAVDREHNLYNVEIQQKREGASRSEPDITAVYWIDLLEAGECIRSFQPVMSYLLRKQMRWGIICRFITAAEKSVKTERIFQTALISFMWIQKIRRTRSLEG